MKKNLILPILAISLASANISIAQNTVVDYGEATNYVSSSQNLAGGNGSFSTSSISPASNYTGPSFWGGIVYSVGGGAATWQLADNYSTAGNNDAIRGSRSGMSSGDSATYAFMFDGSQTFSIDNTANSSFFLKGRRDGGQTGAGTTGVRWMLRDTGGNYYVSALNDTSDAQFSNTYANNTGVTGSSLVGLDWFEYTFSTGTIGSAVTDEVALFSSTQFNAAGFRYTAARVTGAGSLDMSFADFTVVAVPEPGTYALIGGLLALSFVALRRRQS